jgi:hypothetical protein
MPDASPLARRILAHLEAAAQEASQPLRLTVTELGAQLGLDRRVLDAALGELDDLALIAIRGGASTHESHVAPTQLASAARHPDPASSAAT